MTPTETYSPTQVQPASPTEMLIAWTTGDAFKVPYFEIRFECPCAGCVDEKTGRRVLRREEIAPAVRPLGIEPVGRYALQIRWSDGHATGLYSYERLMELCLKYGLKTAG